MSNLIPSLIVVGLLASISPVAIMVLVTLMLTKNPIRNALWFFVGFTLLLIALGVAAVFVFHVGSAKGSNTVSGWIDIGLGILCLALILLSFRKKKEKPEKKDAKPLSAAKAFVIGLATMATNTSTIVIYLAGTHQITDAHLGPSQDVLALAIMTAVTLITLIVPIAVYLIFPKKADTLLASLKVWLTKHSRMIGIAILAIFGVYLLIKGIKILV